MSRLITGGHFYLSEKVRNRYYMYLFYVARKEGGFFHNPYFPIISFLKYQSGAEKIGRPYIHSPFMFRNREVEKISYFNCFRR